MALTNAKIDNAKPQPKPQKLRDGNGLYLYIPAARSPTTVQAPASLNRTTKSWRYDYRLGSKRYTITFGIYPAIGLAEAREHLHAAKQNLSKGVNPAAEKRSQKLLRQAAIGDTFEALAEAWFDSKKAHRSTTWRETHRLYLRRNLYPVLGSLPVRSITPSILLSALESTKATSSVKVAERVRFTAVQVFDYAVRKLKCEHNPARALRHWESIPPKMSHAPLRGDEVRSFVERVDSYAGYLVTKLCIKLLLLLRPTEY